MAVSVIVYFIISCLVTYYLWSDIGWGKKDWKTWVFYSIIFFFWPIIFFIGIVYAFIVYLNDYFGPRGGCAI